MMICNACDNGSHSKRWPNKPSTCEDCFVDNQIVNAEYSKDPCECHAVGHDKSKLKGIEPLTESLLDEIKAVVTKQDKQLQVTLYQIKQNQRLRDEAETKAEIEHYEQLLIKLQRDKDIVEDDE